MNLTRILLCVTMLAAIAMTASAADINGKWVSQQMREGKAATISYEFKVEGDKVTGAIINQRGQSTPISEGKIKGNQLTFAMIRKNEEKTYRFEFVGTIAGDEIKFQQTGPEGNKLPEFTAKRVK